MISEKIKEYKKQYKLSHYNYCKFLTSENISIEYIFNFLKNIKIDKNTKCWNWIGTIDKNGYARCKRIKGESLAYRLSYVLFVSSIPRGRGKNILVLDHICKNRKCCNPNHLRLVSDKENLLNSNAPAIVNSRKTHCKNGHLLPEPKIIKTTGKKMRICKICKKEYDFKRYHKTNNY